MKDLIIVATITAKEGTKCWCAKRWSASCRQAAPKPAASATTCIDLGNHASFVMLEAWRDEAALAEHEATPHFQELVKPSAAKPTCRSSS
jgi:hypothetical protein